MPDHIERKIVPNNAAHIRTRLNCDLIALPDGVKNRNKAISQRIKSAGVKCKTPRYVGKMNLYLSLLDCLEKGENENQSIAIILYADKDHLDVEIIVQDVNKSLLFSYSLDKKSYILRFISPRLRRGGYLS